MAEPQPLGNKHLDNSSEKTRREIENLGSHPQTSGHCHHGHMWSRFGESEQKLFQLILLSGGYFKKVDCNL